MALTAEVLEERRGAVVLLSINRPEKRNALNESVVGKLASALASADSDDAVSAVVLTGAGDAAFSAGADMSERLERRDSRGSWPAIDAASSFSKPLIAAVNGIAYGGGAVLALACDVRIGCERSQFRFVGAKYGLVAGAAHLPRIVGPARAKEFLFTARVIEPQEALQVGILTEVVPGEAVVQHALELADRIAENSLAALKAAKHIVDSGAPVQDARRLETQYNEQLRSSQDHQTRFQDAAARLKAPRNES